MKLLIAVAAASLALAAAASAATPDSAVFTVDASHTTGTLKPFRGVNGVPNVGDADLSKVPTRMRRPPDVSAGYREAKVNLVRTHDAWGAGDIDKSSGPLPKLSLGMFGSDAADALAIFPNLSADPSDPKSYNFGPADKMVAGIRAIDADVIYRLGREAGATATPPTDLAKYREIIRHIVLHFNKGWDHGFQKAVRYWEVWNEPDLDHIWWRGTPQQYYAFYAAAAQAVKAADPKALIGGPTMADVNETSPYREGFLDFAQAHRLPLDFLSWHYYSVTADDPLDFVRISRVMRRLLDQHGFRSTISVLDEWNYSLDRNDTSSQAQRATFVVSSLIYMQDAPIDLEALYRADNAFGPDGKTPDKTGQALIAVGRMADTPVRLAAKGGDDKGLAIEAGRSRDGNTVKVLIGDYQIPAALMGPRKGGDVMAIPGVFDLKLLPRRTVSYGANHGYALTIKGLKPRDYVVETYRISDSADFGAPSRRVAHGPTIRLDADLAPPGVDLVVLKPRD